MLMARHDDDDDDIHEDHSINKVNFVQGVGQLLTVALS